MDFANTNHGLGPQKIVDHTNQKEPNFLFQAGTVSKIEKFRPSSSDNDNELSGTKWDVLYLSKMICLIDKSINKFRYLLVASCHHMMPGVKLKQNERWDGHNL